MRKVAFGFIAVQYSLGFTSLVFALPRKVKVQVSFAPPTPNSTLLYYRRQLWCTSSRLISFHLSDVPELPEEVEAVVCDAGDLAEGELVFSFSTTTQKRDDRSRR